MKADTLKGMAVVSIEDGAKLGRITDVLFDTRPPHVAALRVAADNQHALIPFGQVHSLGRDAVTVPSRAVAQWAAARAGERLPNLRDLGKLRVVDEAGTFLGTPRDVEIGPDDGCITQLQVHRGGVLGMGGESHTITAADIISLGDEVLVVRRDRPSAVADR